MNGSIVRTREGEEQFSLSRISFPAAHGLWRGADTQGRDSITSITGR